MGQRFCKGAPHKHKQDSPGLEKTTKKGVQDWDNLKDLFVEDSAGLRGGMRGDLVMIRVNGFGTVVREVGKEGVWCRCEGF